MHSSFLGFFYCLFSICFLNESIVSNIFKAQLSNLEKPLNFLFLTTSPLIRLHFIAFCESSYISRVHTSNIDLAAACDSRFAVVGSLGSDLSRKLDLLACYRSASSQNNHNYLCGACNIKELPLLKQRILSENAVFPITFVNCFTLFQV